MNNPGDLMLFISALTLAGLLPFPGGLGTGGASCVPPPAGPEARFALRMVEGLVEGGPAGSPAMWHRAFELWKLWKQSIGGCGGAQPAAAPDLQ